MQLVSLPWHKLLSVRCGAGERSSEEPLFPRQRKSRTLVSDKLVALFAYLLMAHGPSFQDMAQEVSWNEVPRYGRTGQGTNRHMDL